MATEAETLIDGFARAAFEGNAAWFLGSGVSRPSMLASWPELLEPLALELGLTLDEHDDLPAIAQYYINTASGNRGPLVQHVKRILGRRADPSTYHRAVALSSVGTIWTTNYDGLMELALAGVKSRVRVRESDMVELPEPGTIELIKAHGSLGVSSPSELVISTEDYEDYQQRRPNITARLQTDLHKKSFLFLGYGYGDPNIRTILVEARRLAERATLSHWMLAKAVDSKNFERVKRQALWKIDLARIGIRCVLVDNYDEIERIILRLATRTRGPTIYVTGSHVVDDARAADVGRLLAEREPTILLDGQSTGVSRNLLSAFQAACISHRIDLNERMRFFPNPYAADPKFSNDPALLPVLKRWRSSLLRQAHSVLVFDGGMGTQAETEIAMELGCSIVPVPSNTTGSAYALLNNPLIAADLEKRRAGYVAKAKALAVDAHEIVNCLLADMPPWPR